MKILLYPPVVEQITASVRITGSKSESNRLLLLQALFPDIRIENISESDDSVAMAAGVKVEQGVVDIHHAGTAMRFLTAFFASQPGREVLLTGSDRMKERPISVLVDALRQLGAEIEYAGNAGYPPLRIKGKKLELSQVQLPADISSQYISALLLIAPALPQGLELELLGKITSRPYIEMTLALLRQIGVGCQFGENRISVRPLETAASKTLVVESDWSSASYFYSLISMAAPGSEIRLSAYRENSLQGDSVLIEIYKEFGVETAFETNGIVLRKTATTPSGILEYDLANAPDLAQTIAVNCFGLGIGCRLSGLHTLKIKETDRLEALREELTKLGAAISVTDRSLELKAGAGINPSVAIDTYHDHRMAMAFAPLALKQSLAVNDADVVSKSYPDYWKDLESVGIRIERIS